MTTHPQTEPKIFVAGHRGMVGSALHQDTYLKVLRLLETNPQMSQRELAAAVGVSLGKTNFCLKALLDKGLLKMRSALLKLHPKEAKIPPCA